jgi:anti-sigma factor NepR-like protein
VQQTKKPTFSKRTPDEWRDWSSTKDRIGEQLRRYYQAYTTEELPPRLRALIEKLGEETQLSGEEPDITTRDVEN